jgi:hypothetical protein
VRCTRLFSRAPIISAPTCCSKTILEGLARFPPISGCTESLLRAVDGCSYIKVRIAYPPSLRTVSDRATKGEGKPNVQNRQNHVLNVAHPLSAQAIPTIPPDSFAVLRQGKLSGAGTTGSGRLRGVIVTVPRSEGRLLLRARSRFPIVLSYLIRLANAMLRCVIPCLGVALGVSQYLNHRQVCQGGRLDESGIQRYKLIRSCRDGMSGIIDRVLAVLTRVRRPAAY